MAKGFMDDWLKPKKNRDPNKLSRFTVRNDRYDRQDLERLLKEMPDFDAYREKLADSRAGELAYGIWQDLYGLFWKVDPQFVPDGMIRPDHLINRVVAEEAEKLPDSQELRRWTMGDDIGTALAMNTIEPDVETLYEKLEEEMEKAKELMQQMKELAAAQAEERDLDEMLKEMDEQGQEPSDEQKQKQKDLQDQIQQMEDGISDAAQELRDMLNGKRPTIKQEMKDALGKAVDEQETMSAMGESWGLEPGQLHRLPAEKRLELAKRLNNPKFKKIAELFGPMKRLAFTEQRRKVNYAPEEIYDLELGKNINRIIPSEIAKLGDPMRRMHFLSQLVQGHVPQYKMRGYERVAKGGIVYCHDGSGSMGGESEIWAKAVGLCLLHIAKKQKRPFYAIQFGSPGQIRVDDFRDSQNITPEQVIDFAEFFFGGGTDFMSPLNHAVQILNEEYESEGRVKSDIVFATDGMCGIRDDWFEEFKKAQKKIGFAVWGIAIGCPRDSEPLSKICDEKVASISSLRNGENIREIFGGI